MIPEVPVIHFNLYLKIRKFIKQFISYVFVDDTNISVTFYVHFINLNFFFFSYLLNLMFLFLIIRLTLKEMYVALTSLKQLWQLNLKSYTHLGIHLFIIYS